MRRIERLLEKALVCRDEYGRAKAALFSNEDVEWLFDRLDEAAIAMYDVVEDYRTPKMIEWLKRMEEE